MTTPCRKCGAKVGESTKVRIRGRAFVTGYASLIEFRDEGVVWGEQPQSWKEEWECPTCGYYTPI